uniref:Uncharacterized protein n=1 Tax=Siphoviridae sp. ctvyM23 TaxID=2826514 RepID=A0A8S5MHZ5_9CAUD|nr:MAG TPA: hypothetical protein [Siphoviridae sp. ctvyM23]
MTSALIRLAREPAITVHHLVFFHKEPLDPLLLFL